MFNDLPTVYPLHLSSSSLDVFMLTLEQQGSKIDNFKNHSFPLQTSLPCLQQNSSTTNAKLNDSETAQHLPLFCAVRLTTTRSGSDFPLTHECSFYCKQRRSGWWQVGKNKWNFIMGSESFSVRGKQYNNSSLTQSEYLFNFKSLQSYWAVQLKDYLFSCMQIKVKNCIKFYEKPLCQCDKNY